MREKWTGDVVGAMHVNCITYAALAKELGWNVKYLSAVLNGHRKPNGVEEKVKLALSKLIAGKMEGKTFYFNGSTNLADLLIPNSMQGSGGSGTEKKPMSLRELADSLKEGRI